MLRTSSLTLTLALAVCGAPKEDTPPATTEQTSNDVTLALEKVASGLDQPVHLSAPAGDPRLFIVEQPGRIRVVENENLVAAPFLDIVSKVRSGGEQGLLSVAFHPQYRSNGFFFVNYTDRNGDTRIERYTVSADRNIADATSARLVLGIDQRYSNHQGGLNLFGPDGMLYIGMGDGGSQGDPHGNGQNRNALLGKLLRINVDREPYLVPSANPYASGGGRGEIWAIGLRNPWRFSFDRGSGLLYIADVGGDKFEEIDVVPMSAGGVNYGWNITEGPDCRRGSGCNREGLQKPVLSYPTHENGTCAVIGGSVYRGQKIPEIQGQYFYSDYCNSWLRSFGFADGKVTDEHEWPIGKLGSITSFGEDSRGELYITTSSGGAYRIIRTAR